MVSPFLRRGPDIGRMMAGVLVGLCLTVAHYAARYDAGFALRWLACVAFGLGLEVVYILLKDGAWRRPHASTAVTSGLLALSVPAVMPLWQGGVGILVAVLFGKCLVDRRALRVNPMLLGRLAMMLLFADSIQRWWMGRPPADALTTATPLGFFKAEGEILSLGALLLGNVSGGWQGIYGFVPGSPGDLFPLLTLACGLVLYGCGVLDWRSGVTYALGMAAGCWALDLPVGFHLLAGSTAFTMVYIVSDPRSMPGSRAGRLLAGLLAGGLNAVIRWHGYYPEGVAVAVLVTNLLSPTLDRLAFCGRSWVIHRRLP